MVVPKGDPMFRKKGGNFRKAMIEYIKENFSHILGSDAVLLDYPNGLELLREMMWKRYYEISRRWEKKLENLQVANG